MFQPFSFENTTFTDQELYQKLGLASQPSDRELEAKIIMFLRKYHTSQLPNDIRLYQFFNAVYDYFFQSPLEEKKQDIQETFTNNDTYSNGVVTDNNKGTVNDNNLNGDGLNGDGLNGDGLNGIPTQIVSTVEYTKSIINPILKQTIQRIVSIDSKYRNLNASNFKTYPNSTDFTIELSEPLRDVLSLKLYGFTIPYSWYTISTDYGSNFFYLKGTSPGLVDSGAYDFKIAISPGNYDVTSNPNTSLIYAVNQSFKNVASNFTDVHFGSTNLSYNTTNTLATFTIDILNLYQESAFKLDWIRWTSPENTNRSKKITNIPIYLGFDNATYDIHTVFSERGKIPPIEQTINADINQSNYYLDDTNNYFTIIHYYEPPNIDSNGLIYIPEYNSSSKTLKTLNTIVVKLTLNPGKSYSRSEIETNLRNIIFHSSQFYGYKNTYDILQRIDQTDQPFSFYKFHILLNRKELTIQRESKFVILFPDETSIPNKSQGNKSIWTGNQSCFQFNSFNSQNKLQIELNNVYSEFPLIINTYSILNTPTIDLICNAKGYINNNNNVHFEVTNALYNLTDYTKAINHALQNPTKNGIGGYFNTILFEINNNSIPQFNIDYNVTFTDYYVQFPADFTVNNTRIFDFQNFTVKNKPSYINYQYLSVLDFSSFTISNIDPSSTYDIPYNKTNFIVFSPNTNFSDVIFTVPFVYNRGLKITNNSGVTKYQYSKFIDFFNDFNDSIRSFQDIPGSFPINITSNYSTPYNYQIDFTLSVQKHLTQHDFIFKLSYSLPTNIPSWTTFLKFNTDSYDLSLSQYQGNPSIITANSIIEGQTLTLQNGINNFFQFTPQTFSTGLYTNIPSTTVSGKLYNDIYITIPCDNDSNGNPIDTVCNNLTLFNKMNAAFSQNIITRGTQIESITIDQQSYAKLRFNINHAFTAADYILDFFDVSSFIECYVGASSIRNTTWNTTLGWILGFHSQTSYTLYSNIDINYIATITGENAVNINIINYLMISMDDFNQNRLNDGVVTIAKTDTNLPLPSYSSQANFFCYESNGNVSANSLNTLNQNNLTGNQLFALNQVLNSQTSVNKIYSEGPYLKDIFSVIPLKLPSLPNTPITDNGGSLQQQTRIYFGPVNIRKLKIQLYTDQGLIVNLNNNDWSFQFICEQLYQK